MGQYFKPIFLNESKTKPLAYVSCYDFGSGAKLMEHSWMKNNFVGFVERILLREAKPIVWAGDYADADPTQVLTKEEVKLALEDGMSKEHIIEHGINLWSLVYYNKTPKLTHNVDFDYQEGKTKYDFDFKTALPSRFKYLINLDKKEFVDKSKVPGSSQAGWEDWKIHPLPLLTCEGNGTAGGDFRGDEKGLVGRWARDVITVRSKKSDIPKDFKEVIFDLTE